MAKAKVTPKTMGRPTKYDPSKHPLEVVTLMRDKGYLMCEVCNAWDICEDTFAEWVKAHPNFSVAYKRAKAAKKSWWINAGRDGLHNSKGESFNAIVWSMVMRNMGVNTEERAIELRELLSTNTYVESSEVIKKAVSEGRITPKEGKALQEMVATAAKVEEFTEMKRQFEELKNKLEG